ncbi:MAG: hypothetical protein JXA18_04215 [Chitinispirillaceae bacterium]|nr:hypothetical protein [Chitinispirillaceae bacterium]
MSLPLFAAVLIIGASIQTFTNAQNYTLSAEPTGFVTIEGAPTGGGSAPRQIIRTFSELKKALADNTPRVIVISGTIRTTDGDGYGLPVGSNKTIMGINKSATIYGGFAIRNAHDVIIRNLNFNGVYPNPGPGDCIAVQNSHHVWLDHLCIWDADDGNLDITNESSFCTVSWCKFYYTNSENGHRLCCLIGSGGGDHPEDWGNLKVTYHHNWFDRLVTSRMPRLVYGQAHVYNNYYTSEGNDYCIGVGSYGSILIENNYFKKVNNPHQFMYDVYCYMVARNNVYIDCEGSDVNKKSGSRHSGWENEATGEKHPLFEVQPFDKPPYEYTMDGANDVPDLVSKYAGPQFDITSINNSHSSSASQQMKTSASFCTKNRVFQMKMPSSQMVNATIFTLNGKHVYSKMFKSEAGGESIVHISLGELGNGLYLFRATCNSSVQTEYVNVF